MSIATWCVCFAFLLPYVFVTAAKAGGKGFDNRAPRLYLSTLTGWRQRAHWCQQNSFEGFAPFAFAVLACQMAGLAQGTVDALAVGYIVSRVLYGICYVLDWSTCRSLVWMAGFSITIALFILPVLLGV